MKERHLLIAAIVLLVLVIYYAIFEFGISSDTSKQYIGPPILFLNYRDVKKLHIKTSEGKELICERKGKGWEVIKGTKVKGWRSKVADFVSYLISAVEIDKIPVKNSQLSKYGLENPAYEITLTDITDKTYQLIIGDSTPVRTSVYAKFADSPHIIIVGALLNWELSKLSSLFSSS